MSHFLSCNLLADLAFFAKASKILSELIANNNQPHIPLKIIPVKTRLLCATAAHSNLCFSAVGYQAMYSSASLSTNASIKTSNSSLISLSNERTFVRIRLQSNSKELSLDNRLEWEGLLITQLTNGNLEIDLKNWTIWTDDRGYLYFQPTPKALSAWLKVLFDRTRMANQDSEFLAAADGMIASADFLHYIMLRCNQVRKLAEPQINPWSEGGLNCSQAAELELIYGVVGVYDSLYMGKKYKVVAASKSLGEVFLEFDRTCRLLDLDPNSPAFHERAGLIAIVQSAIRDLGATQTKQ